jgi:hypothetical protein
MLSPAALAPSLHDVTAPPLVGAFAQSQGTLALGRTLTSPWRLALGMRVSRAVHATRRSLRSACLATPKPRTYLCQADAPPRLVAHAMDAEDALRVVLRFFPHAACPALTDALVELRHADALAIVRAADPVHVQRLQQLRAEAQEKLASGRLTEVAAHTYRRRLLSLDDDLARVARRAA